MCPLFDMLTPKPSRYPEWFHKLHAGPGEDKITVAKDVATGSSREQTSNGHKPCQRHKVNCEALR